MKLRIISRDEVKSAVSMAQAIETVKSAFAQLSRGTPAFPSGRSSECRSTTA